MGNVIELFKKEEKELRITSVELVELINQFRQLENELNGKRYVELKHSDFMKKIKSELKVLESIGISSEGNISLGSYIDKQNQQRPCYSLNRDGMLQMLSSESAIVRSKAIEYINKLEEENRILKEEIHKKAKLLLDIYEGGQAGVIASKELTRIEVEEATAPLLDKIKEDEPYVETGRTITKSENCILVRELAKIISDEVVNIGEKKLYNKLRDWNYIMQGKTEPYQKYIENGYFVVEEKAINIKGKLMSTRTTKVTGKGQSAIINKLKRELTRAI